MSPPTRTVPGIYQFIPRDVETLETPTRPLAFHYQHGHSHSPVYRSIRRGIVFPDRGWIDGNSPSCIACASPHLTVWLYSLIGLFDSFPNVLFAEGLVSWVWGGSVRVKIHDLIGLRFMVLAVTRVLYYSIIVFSQGFITCLSIIIIRVFFRFWDATTGLKGCGINTFAA